MKTKDQIILEEMYDKVNFVNKNNVFEEYENEGLGQSSEILIEEAIKKVKELIDSTVKEKSHKPIAKSAIIKMWIERLMDSESWETEI